MKPLALIALAAAIASGQTASTLKDAYQGIFRVGAALSPALGGWIAQEISYSAMFLILGSFALGSIALWIGFASVLKPACVRHERASAARLSAVAGVH